MARYSLHFSTIKVHFFDMNYPISNTQGVIYLKKCKDDPYLFQILKPINVPILSKFLYEEGKQMKFLDYSNDPLKQNEIKWQFAERPKEMFVPIKDLFFEYLEKYKTKDIIQVRLQY